MNVLRGTAGLIERDAVNLSWMHHAFHSEKRKGTHVSKILCPSNERMKGNYTCRLSNRSFPVKRVQGLFNTIYSSNFRNFGADEWGTYFGEIGEKSSIPNDIKGFLKSQDPENPKKKIFETHTLVWIPEKFNGNRFSIESFNELQKQQRSGHPVSFDFHFAKNLYGASSLRKSYWILLKNTPIYPSETPLANDYRFASTLELLTCLSFLYAETGKWLFEAARTRDGSINSLVSAQNSKIMVDSENFFGPYWDKNKLGIASVIRF